MEKIFRMPTVNESQWVTDVNGKRLHLTSILQGESDRVYQEQVSIPQQGQLLYYVGNCNISSPCLNIHDPEVRHILRSNNGNVFYLVSDEELNNTSLFRLISPRGI